ncbi:hypothetical protein [Allostreptomyces psammosilenae]|uniref:Maltokinase n=1 Tax=Allostreptomyces psammosilenae TaxID=1892865 RepID=A0A852ZTX5_9ACTN|nr:hypothetical protein [Allostreptomyces psammosilenae]NYI04214.1 maltokinase [Allostreptomyces psammosilenae]
MDTQPDGVPGTALAALLRAAPWLPEHQRRADRFRIADWAELPAPAPPEGRNPDGRLLLLVVAPEGGTADGTRYFVPVALPAGPAGAAALAEAHGTAAFDTAAVRRVLAGRPLRTARGHLVEFRPAGRPDGDRPVRQLPFARGWSSNALSLVDLAGRPHIHKTYRALDPDTREPDLLRLMDGGGRTPALAGDYGYLDTGTGVRHPLGVVYAYAPGDGVDAPLRANMRSLWPLLRDAAAPERTAVAHLAPLERELRRAGSFLRGFHDDLRARIGEGAASHLPFPAEHHLDEAARRLGELAPAVAAGDGLPARVSRAALDALRREVTGIRARLRDPATSAPPSGPCHGDLHLSHLLCRPRDGADDRADGGWELCVIDLSTPCADPDSPHYPDQSPWQDLVAVQRALEYFTADEAAEHAAHLLGTDNLSAARAALLDTAGALVGTPGWPPGRRAVLRRVHLAADAWRARVLRLLLDGYARGGASPAGHPLWRLLRLRRLLHEVAYNQAHDRPYYLAMDLRHALAPAAPTTDPAPSAPAATDPTAAPVPAAPGAPTRSPED